MISIVGITACTGAPVLPDYDLPALTAADKTAARPGACVWPDFVTLEIGGVSYNALDRNNWIQYLGCVDVAETNAVIANANADAIEALADMYQGATDISERQQDYAQFTIDELESDRREAAVEAWTAKGILAAVLIAVAL